MPKADRLSEPVMAVSAARAGRIDKVITREQYWEIVRTKLRVLKEFQEVAEREDLVIRLTPKNIELDINLNEFSVIVSMHLNVEDVRSVPFTVIAEGAYEGFQAKLIFKLGQVSSEFLDIGANMGFYSLAIPKINPNLKVHSFEPQPGTYSTLVKNLDLNKLQGSVTAHNCGLGSVNTTATMFIPKFTGSGGGSFANLHSEEGNPEQVEVQVNTLDTYLDSTINPDLIKIDVEGFEYEVLSGGLQIIEHHKPTIVIELLRKWMKSFGKHPQDVIRMLSPFGYKVYAIGENELIPIDTIDELTLQTNFIFIHKDNHSHFNILSGFVRS